jgi:hypothetical protein
MSEAALRRATAADADKLTTLARAAYARHVAVIGREPMPMTADWAKLNSEQEIWIRLMAFAETRARELQRPELRLFTNARMEGNIALYRRLGYSETRREDLADRVLVHMSKAVDVDGTIGT